MFLLADEDDLHDVISAVTGLSGRWQDLGTSLRLRSSDLDSIFSASAQTPRDCLRKVVTLWLRQSYNVCITNHPPPPTHTHTHTGVLCKLIVFTTLGPHASLCILHLIFPIQLPTQNMYTFIGSFIVSVMQPLMY